MRDGEDRGVNGRQSGLNEDDPLGSVRDVLAGLPRELDPERDLLPEIAARAWRKSEGEATVPRPSDLSIRDWWRASLGIRVQLAAAAVVLVVITSVLTALILGDRGAPGTTVAGRMGSAPGSAPVAATATMSPVGHADLEAAYAHAIGELLAALERSSQELPPETRALIEENLLVIDGALREALAALEAAPDDAGLRQTVILTYEQKLEFLRTAAALTMKS
jgi:hypothetical protein